MLQSPPMVSGQKISCTFRLDKPVAKSVFIVPPLSFVKHFAGQHDQSSHGNWAHGHSTDRPYELDLSRKDNQSWGTRRGYKEDVAKGDGPIAQFLHVGGGWWGTPLSTAEFYYAGIAEKTSGRNDGLMGDAILEKIANDIYNDPEYPQMPKKIIDEVLATNQGLWQGRESNPVNIDDIRRRAIKIWAKENPESAKAYLVKENEFVRKKIREIKFPSGQTVGEVSDGVAQSLLDQMKEIANNNDVSLTMTTGKLKKFIEEDHYRTGHETNLSRKGSTREKYIERRDDFEEEKMGIPYGLKSSEKPVYGVIGRNAEEVTYGDAQVIFKDAVKHRTTATVGDSLDGFVHGTHWLEDYATGSVSVEDLWKTHAKLLIDTFNNSRRSGTTYTWQKDKDGRDVWGGITGYSGKADLRAIAIYGYVETQIHGGLSLKDVAKIVIPKSTSLTKATKDMLAGKGIEVIVGDHIEKRK